MGTSHRMVAHIWANRSKASATGHNLWFDGDTIYSYGRHFPIARHVAHKGKPAILFTSRDYSSSTSQHKSIVRRALRDDVPVFYVFDPTHTPHKSDRAAYETRILACLEKATRAKRHADTYLQEAAAIVAGGNALAQFFGLRWRLKMPEDYRAAVASATQRAVRAQARAARQRLRREAEYQREIAARVPLWRAGERVSIDRHPETLLRLRGDLIETSRGATFPVEHGKRAFRLIAQCRANGGAWERNGHAIHLGNFQIDRIAANGDVTAGCHVVKWTEIVRIAAQLDLVTAIAC